MFLSPWLLLKLLILLKEKKPEYQLVKQLHLLKYQLLRIFEEEIDIFLKEASKARIFKGMASLLVISLFLNPTTPSSRFHEKKRTSILLLLPRSQQYLNCFLASSCILPCWQLSVEVCHQLVPFLLFALKTNFFVFFRGKPRYHNWRFS